MVFDFDVCIIIILINIDTNKSLSETYELKKNIYKTLHVETKLKTKMISQTQEKIRYVTIPPMLFLLKLYDK